jgi:polyhydroxyalkanoate synthesis regulator phasin
MKKILVLISLLFLFIYCITPQNDEIIKIEDTSVYESPTVEVTEVQEEVVEQEKIFSDESKSYFDEVVNKSEFSDSRCVLKWKDDVKIFVKGKKVDYLMVELDKIVSELNGLIEPINISVVNNENESNMIIYFGDYITFGNLYPDVTKTNLENNYGYFRIDHKSNNIYFAKLYVDIYRTSKKSCEKHLLREELTQSLGLKNDSNKYPESIFYSEWTETTSYAEIDKELIQMLYN